MMYIDSGEYWLSKTGKDTRAYLIAIQNLAIKGAIAVSAGAMGVILMMINFEAGETLSQAGMTSLTWAMGLSPAVGYIIPIAILLIHGVSDNTMLKCIAENEKKLSAESGESV
jgi:Na+/melibiose symporter-like transporter